MKHKKLLSLLLAVCMVLAVLPSFASAETIEVKDTLDKTLIGVDGTTYKTWAGITSESNAIYAGQSAGGNDSIQLRSSNNNSGIVTTGSGGTVQTVAVEWNSNTADGRTLNVYGKSTAYSAATDLYGNNAGTLIGTIVKGTSTELAITDEYEYIGLRSASGAMYLTSIEITWSADSETPPPTLYTVSFDANGGTGTMADVTTASPYTLPNCAFTAPEGQEFDCWTIDGDEGMYDPGDTYELTGDTTFVAQWKDLPVVTYTDMMLKRVPSNGDEVVIYYPAASKVVTGTDYLYNNKKHELVAANATLTDDVLAVPDEALRLTVTTTVADDGETTLYTFATEDGRYLLADGTNVQLVDEQGANTLFQLETAAAGTDNWYIKCDSATVSGKTQYIEYYGGYFTVYSLNTSNAAIYTFQFFSENGEGPTPAATYIVTLDPGEADDDPVVIEDATSPYTLPDCTFTAPEGMVFDGWTMAGGDGDVYPAGAQVTLEEPNVTFIAQWKELIARNYRLVTSDEDLVDGETYLIASELFVDELYVMSNQTANNRAQYKVSGVDGETITLDETWIATSANDALAFEFTLVDAEDGWAFYDEVTGGYLYAASSSSNWLRTETELDDNGKFAIELGADGATVPIALGENQRNYMHYNGESSIFSCYAETSHVTAAVYLYRFVEDEPVELSNGFYLIGPNWTVSAIDATQKFGENMNASGEYLLAAKLAAGDEIKVVKVANGAITAWYPDGMDNQYTVDAAHAGDVTIYFRETYNSDWAAFGGYFYIEADFAITCVSGEHGLVSTAAGRAAAGTTVTIYLEAEDEYEVDSLTVMCGDTEVETKKVNDWQYTFVMPAGNVTITATFREEIGQLSVWFIEDYLDWENGWTELSVDYGAHLDKPEDPEKEGYVFGGWYKQNPAYEWWTDSDGFTYVTIDDEGNCVDIIYLLGDWIESGAENYLLPWDFENDVVTQETELYAKWTEEVTAPFFKSQNLILDGLIGVSFNMELPAIEGVDYTTSYMTFIVEHGTCTERVDYTESTAKKSGTQGFVCYVNAVQMAEPITATFHYTQNDTELTVEKTYAIKDYFIAYDDSREQFDTETQALIEAVADYGHYVQAMLAEQKGWTLGTTFVEMDKFYATSYNIGNVAAAVEDEGITCENNGAQVSKLNFAMVFDSATELRVLFKVAKAYTGTLTATVDGNGFDVNTLGTAKAVQITNIPANLLSHPYEVVITMDGGSATITASALSYVKAMLASASSFSAPAVMQNAAAAIYSYSAAADAYKQTH